MVMFVIRRFPRLSGPTRVTDFTLRAVPLVPEVVFLHVAALWVRAGSAEVVVVSAVSAPPLVVFRDVAEVDSATVTPLCVLFPYLFTSALSPVVVTASRGGCHRCCDACSHARSQSFFHVPKLFGCNGRCCCSVSYCSRYVDG